MRENGHIVETQSIIILTTYGGDCTSFISQCIYAGSGIMNNTKDTGWYYNNINSRSPSWSGVEFLYNFLTTNKGIGPFGKEVNIEEAEIGDISQINFDGKVFGHSQIIVDKLGNNFSDILIATHTYDSLNRALSTYQNVQKIRFIHIEGVRIW